MNDSNAPQSWSLVIFGLNEAATLPSVVNDCLQLLNEWGSTDHEVIIVDDGSTDETPQVAAALAAKNPHVRVVTHEVNRGIGSALRSGYEAALKENVCAVPADAQFSISELKPFPVMEEGRIISFIRTVNTSYTLYRKFLSTVNRKLNAWGMGIRMRDVNWIKIYKTKDVQGLKLETRSQLVESEICGKLLAHGHKITEVPSVYIPRSSGKSHAVKLSTVFASFKETLKLVKSVRKYRKGLRKGL